MAASYCRENSKPKSALADLPDIANGKSLSNWMQWRETNFLLMSQRLQRVKFRGALRRQQSRHQSDEGRKGNHAQREGGTDDKEIAAHGKLTIPQINRNDLIQANPDQPAEQ